MVSIGTIIAATIILGAVFLRRQIGEAGVLIGGGAGELGLGIQTLVSSILSPSIMPAFIPTIGVQTQFPDIPDITRPDKPRPEENCREVSVFSICSPGESSRGFPGISKFCCPSEGAIDRERNGEREDPIEREKVEFDPTRFSECYQRELSNLEEEQLFRTGEPCVQPRFSINSGGFDVSEIASRLGFRDLSTAQASNIRLGQTGLGALTQAFRRGEIGEDVLRSGFRETIR